MSKYYHEIVLSPTLFESYPDIRDSEVKLKEWFDKYVNRKSIITDSYKYGYYQISGDIIDYLVKIPEVTLLNVQDYIVIGDKKSCVIHILFEEKGTISVE